MQRRQRCYPNSRSAQLRVVGRCTSGSIVFTEVALIGYWIMLPSFRIFLPFHAELTVLARPISIRLDLVDVLSGTTRPGFEHDHLSAHSRIHTRTFRVRACAQISARQRMHGTGCNSSWTARVEIIKPARRADNDFDPINSAFRALPPLRCHVNGKRTGPSCERSNIWKEDGTIV